MAPRRREKIGRVRMSTSAALLVVLLAVLAASAAAQLVWRLVGPDFRRRHHEVGSAIFLQIGVIYAVLLAFVFSEVWSQYNEAAQSINAECGDLHGAAIYAASLGHATGDPVERAIATYIRAVIDDDWPAMAADRRSERAAAAEYGMLDTAARIPTDAAASAVHGQILSLLADAHARRETRLFQATQNIPPPLWVLLIVYAGVLIGFVAFSSLERRSSHVLMNALFALCIVMVLVLIRMFDLQFSGALALPATDFHETLEKVVALTGPAAPR